MPRHSGHTQGVSSENLRHLCHIGAGDVSYLTNNSVKPFVQSGSANRHVITDSLIAEQASDL